MDTLPPEVYSQIVHLLQPTRPPRHTLPVEVTLSHVSTGWRSLAFSDSKSWELVEVFSPRTLPRAAAYASRAAGAAIYLRVDIYDYESRHASDHGAFVASLADLLQSSAPRCKSILIFTYHEQTAQQLLSVLTDVNVPLLQSLRVNIDDTAREEGEEGHKVVPLAVFSGGAPALKFVELETPSFPPFHQLVTLHLHAVTCDWFSFKHFSRIAKEVPNLENLSLSPKDYITRRDQWPVHLENPEITMPSLQSLRILEDHPGLALRVLLSVDTPNLQSLYLKSSSDEFGKLFGAPQIQRSNGLRWPKLQYLTLEYFNMQDTAGLARTFTTVSHLRLSYILTWFFARFATAVGTPGIWPNLHTLVVEVTRNTYAEKLKEALSKIASDRRAQGLPIPRVLGDADIVQILKRSDLLNEVVGVEELSTGTWEEHWWLTSHKKTMDQIGLL